MRGPLALSSLFLKDHIPHLFLRFYSKRKSSDEIMVHFWLIEFFKWLCSSDNVYLRRLFRWTLIFSMNTWWCVFISIRTEWYITKVEHLRILSRKLYWNQRDLFPLYEVVYHNFFRRLTDIKTIFAWNRSWLHFGLARKVHCSIALTATVGSLR